MENQSQYATLDERPATRSQLLRLGVWTRAMAIAFMVAAAGIAAIVEQPHHVSILTAVTWIAVGAAVAWFAWQRARSLADRWDAPPAARVRARFIRSATGATASS